MFKLGCIFYFYRFIKPKVINSAAYAYVIPQQSLQQPGCSPKAVRFNNRPALKSIMG